MMYGALPQDLGRVDVPTDEMMFWLYCPIKTPEAAFVYLPDNLAQFTPILQAVKNDDHDRFEQSFVYLTAKTLWASQECVGNRPGWHSDGFGTDDLNYIWYDRAPTVFVRGAFELPSDCEGSMQRMAELAFLCDKVTYPDRHLLRLDQTVVHRSPDDFKAGMRTFVKVSISSERYNLLGNSINHNLPESWPLVARQASRNHPVSPPPDSPYT